MTRACLQPAHTLDNTTQNSRSLLSNFGRGRHLLVDGKLLAQSKVLQGDLTVAAAEHREQSKQVEQESDH
jgi:hypothetical protein